MFFGLDLPTSIINNFLFFLLEKFLIFNFHLHRPYSLDNLEDYEKHFTVMNYRPVNLKQVSG